MKDYFTMFLKFIIIVIGILVSVICILGMLLLYNKPFNPHYDYFLYPIFIGAIISVIPICFALFKGYCLLNYIDANDAFSIKSVKALKQVKISAIIISIIYIIILPFVYLLADMDDSPGLIIIALIPIFATLIISIFVAILEKLLKEAIHIKTENELISMKKK